MVVQFFFIFPKHLSDMISSQRLCFNSRFCSLTLIVGVRFSGYVFHCKSFLECCISEIYVSGCCRKCWVGVQVFLMIPSFVNVRMSWDKCHRMDKVMCSMVPYMLIFLGCVFVLYRDLEMIFFPVSWRTVWTTSNYLNTTDIFLMSPFGT